MAKKILLGLTTITKDEWKNKVKEIDELGINELALFPTCLNFNERKELYELLSRTRLVSIPHVHIREEDFTNDELQFLIDKYQTKVFNIHANSRESSTAIIKKHQAYLNLFFVENLHELTENFEEVVKQIGGLCLDLAHWEDYGYIRKYKGYEKLGKLAKKYKIGVNHISAIKSELVLFHEKASGKDYYDYSSHLLGNLNELDYVKKYKDYLADIISIELENSLKEQIQAKKYLEKILEI
jgi:hypothetical protein